MAAKKKTKKAAAKKAAAKKPAAKKPAAAAAAKKPAAKKPAPAPKKTAKTVAKAPTVAAPKKAKKVIAREEPPAVVKKPKKPAKANKPLAVPYQKTILQVTPPPPPKPKATISRAKAVELASSFLKERVGKAELYAPRSSKFRLGNVSDRNGMINIHFCHEADDSLAPTISSLSAKCLEVLIAAHPQLRAFDIDVQTIRM